MRRTKTAVFGAIALGASLTVAVTAPPAGAATITVPGDHTTVQAAVDAAAEGDLILVAAGTYVETVEVRDKSVTIASVDPSHPATIDGSADGARAILLVDSDATLRNLRVTTKGGTGGGIGINGGAPLVIDNEVTGNGGCSGAGIEARSTDARIEGNHIHHNHTVGCSGGAGGNGVMIGGAGNVELIDNLIEYNSHTSSGGGITLNASGPALIDGNVIRHNTATSSGGGITVINNSPARITNNLFVDNSGSVAYLSVSSSNTGLTITHNTFVDNTGNGPQIHARGFTASTRIANNILVGDGMLVTCDPSSSSTIPQFATNLIPAGTSATIECGGSFDWNTVIGGEPAFVAAWDGDYRLSDGSTAIDAGSAEGITTDFENETRPIDGDGDGTAAPDIGFDEAPTDPPAQKLPPAPPEPPASLTIDANGTLGWTPANDATGHTVRWHETRVPSGWLNEASLGTLVVGGAPVDISRHRYGTFVVGFDSANKAALQCGGTLIDDEWMLTAAHCTRYQPTGTYYTPVSYLSVVYGLDDWADIDGNRDSHLRFSDQIRVHPGYNPTTFANDIALVHLEEPIDPALGHTIPLLGTEAADESPAFVTGWGAINNAGALPQVVHGVGVGIDASCGTWPDEAGASWNDDLYLCASAPHAGACNGDSGGPLVVNQAGIVNLAGVASFGPAEGCGLVPDRPDVFTRVAPQIDWIESVTGPLGGKAELGGTASTFALPTLEPGRTYAVTVQADNENGLGSAAVVRHSVPGQFLFSATELGVECGSDPALPFVDVSSSSFAYTSIGCIFELAVTTGTSPTTYSPASPVTREQMAAFIARLYERLTGDSCTDTHPFSDVRATSFAAGAIGCIYGLGITTGTSPTTYSPGNVVTREQMAAFTARLYRRLTSETCRIDTDFVDVGATSFARRDIGCIADVGITTGTSPTTYSPGNVVTREQMAAFIARMFLTVSV